MEERSRRLRLIPATAESVKLETESLGRLGELIGAHVPNDWPPETLRDALPVFLEWHTEHPDWHGWFGWYAVRLDGPSPVLCGSVGFKGRADAVGMVEIGYSVLPDHQGVGLATEMVAKLVEWAWGQEGVRSIEAGTTLANPASVRVLERTGFQLASTNSETGAVRYRHCGGEGHPTTRWS